MSETLIKVKVRGGFAYNQGRKGYYGGETLQVSEEEYEQNKSKFDLIDRNYQKALDKREKEAEKERKKKEKEIKDQLAKTDNTDDDSKSDENEDDDKGAEGGNEKKDKKVNEQKNNTVKK